MKKIVGPSDDLALCLQLISHHIIDLGGDGLQIIDLGGGDGLFCEAFKNKLPKAVVKCIDKSEVMIGLSKNTEGVQMIQDDLFNFPNYVEEEFETLVVCRGTIHHLPDPIKAINYIITHNKGGLFIKDLIRSDEESEMDVTIATAMALARNLDTLGDDICKIITKLTRQSLFAALSKKEILKIVSNYSYIEYSENKHGTYYVLSKSLG